MGGRWVRAVGYSVATVVAAGLAGAGILLGQVQHARRTIPRAQAPPPPGDGWYGPRRPGPPLTLVMLGDSVAAGYGVDKPRQTPGALLAAGLSRRLGRPVRLRRLAVPGATSARLAPQVEAALELRPDLAVIVIGGNDITHRANLTEAVQHLVAAVRALRGVGAQVVVGTCPDLGTIRPIQPPLRSLARYLSRRLAAAQTVAVVNAGGWTVSLADLLGPRFEAEPHRMFGRDQFHPSADGYATAAAALLPTALAALGAGTPTRAAGVRSLPQAAVEASQQAGTEVSGASVAGRERGPSGPAGRVAALRQRARAAIRPPTDAAHLALDNESVES